MKTYSTLVGLNSLGSQAPLKILENYGQKNLHARAHMSYTTEQGLMECFKPICGLQVKDTYYIHKDTYYCL